jgi:hypothetical protein
MSAQKNVEESVRTPSSVHSEHSSSSPLRGLLLLMPFVKRRNRTMVSPKVVQILNLVDPDDPVLAREGFLDRCQLWALGRKSYATDTVSGLAGGEEGVVVIVGHLVPFHDFVSDEFGMRKEVIRTSSCCA